ncbi:TadE-like protein [Actinomadura rubteroloni]|uniref:TadE-like protein n=1 Tax=Actinomadura rubteroloni TaxID=1926885 RepID=A0A2P4UJ17_9ACTN|nr:TadE/TadG family type IV pilus assembly protein [Actinomadura rubteroloni]POM25062.1 TadE-like protein [Actinomadura rubteroloni]
MRRIRDDAGAVATEFAGVFPIALVMILVAFQAYMASTTVERVENAARTGAREASKEMNPGRCAEFARAALPDWLNEHAVSAAATTAGGTDAVSCTVRAQVPLLWKGVPLDFGVTRTVTMPLG